MASDRPELPKGWEWRGTSLPVASRRLGYVSMEAYHGENEWTWQTWGCFRTSGKSTDLVSAARAAEAAVVEWAEKLIAEVKGAT